MRKVEIQFSYSEIKVHNSFVIILFNLYRKIYTKLFYIHYVTFSKNLRKNLDWVGLNCRSERVLGDVCPSSVNFFYFHCLRLAAPTWFPRAFHGRTLDTKFLLPHFLGRLFQHCYETSYYIILCISVLIIIISNLIRFLVVCFFIILIIDSLTFSLIPNNIVYFLAYTVCVMNFLLQNGIFLFEWWKKL